MTEDVYATAVELMRSGHQAVALIPYERNGKPCVWLVVYPVSVRARLFFESNTKADRERWLVGWIRAAGQAVVAQESARG